MFIFLCFKFTLKPNSSATLEKSYTKFSIRNHKDKTASKSIIVKPAPLRPFTYFHNFLNEGIFWRLRHMNPQFIFPRTNTI